MTHSNEVRQSGVRRVARTLQHVFTDVNRAQRAWFVDFVRLDTVAGSGERVRH